VFIIVLPPRGAFSLFPITPFTISLIFPVPFIRGLAVVNSLPAGRLQLIFACAAAVYHIGGRPTDRRRPPS